MAIKFEAAPGHRHGNFGGPDSPPMSLASRYTILRKIADGGTAEIFLAKQHGAQGFEKMVVLKRIFTTFYADPQFRHMLVDEAHVAMTLNHSNIVQVLDLGESEGRYFLAMELVDGWTLDRILRRAKAAGVPFPPALALYLTAEICRALAYAHAKARPDGMSMGIVHRDMSPHNVLVSEQGEIKITDFGIAKAQTRQSEGREQSVKNLIKGKIAFMSPEQASAGELDARSDLFSVGTMLYVMITRRHPFDAPTDYETLMLVKSGDYMPPETARPGLNPELYRVIRKAMAKTPADRYQKAEEMLVDVEQVMRLAFRPVGQTELQRWLADLTAKDGVPTLTREAPPEPPASQSTVGPLRAGDGQESGLVLDLGDAVEVKGGKRPPPVPAPTVPMMHPPQFARQDTPWIKRREVRIAGIVLLLVIGGFSVRAMVSDRTGGVRNDTVGADRKGAGSGSNVSPKPATPATAPVVPAPEPPPHAAPVPAAQAVDAASAVAAKPAGNAVDAAAKAADAGPSTAEAAAAEEPKEPAAAKQERPAKEKRAQQPVHIKTDPDGTKVSAGKHVFGSTPITVRMRPGNSYELTFTKAGYTTLSRRYRFDDDAPQTLRVSLKKLPEPPKKPAPAPPPAGPPAPKKSSWFGR
jgi:eukaryotic-like serine/threonine-protein kinase